MKLPTCPLALPLLILLCTPFAAHAECEGPPQPSVLVKVDAAPVPQDRLLSLAMLSKLPSESRRAGMEDYDHTLGMTEADFGTRNELELVTVDDGAGGYCSTVQSATITLIWKSKIHLASEIVPGSCLDKEIIIHEQKHVEIDRTLIPVALRAIEVSVTEVAREGVKGSSVADAEQALKTKISDSVEEALDIFSVVRKRKQLAHDSPEEYDSLSKTCGIMEYLRLLRDSALGITPPAQP